MFVIYLRNGRKEILDEPCSGADLASLLHTDRNLAHDAVLTKIDGKLIDLLEVLPNEKRVEIVCCDDPEALPVLRHSCAHLLAAAVKALYPEAKLGVGPATEDGFFYDFQLDKPFVPEDLQRIEEKMREMAQQDTPIVHCVVPRSEAIEILKKQGELFKLRLLEDIADEQVSLYRIGDVYDLCRGPHYPMTSRIGQAFKILKSAGAYWKGDKNQEQMQRIYGTVWPTQEALDAYFLRREEAEKRDHRKIGLEQDLFHLQDLAPGTVFWHTKGWTLYRTLRNFIRGRIEKNGYKEVNTPMLADKILWEKSGHWEKFRENMFVTELEDGRTMAIKPMNCPCHIQIFNQKIVSYRDLPWRMAEFGSCHRYEPSGALHGLMRVRGFVQDDAHIFCTKDQIVSETQRFCELLRGIYKTLGFESFFVKFSDRPAKRAGTDAIWDLAEGALKEAAEAAHLSYQLNPGEGAFYGPKLEFVLKDCLGRDWQCGTLQVDFVLPERLDAWYVTESGEKEHPVMLHRAVLGSLERFLGILIEHYAGRFPTWLAPVQAVVATITEDANPAAEAFAEQLCSVGVRVELDTRNEKISYKVREHSLQKIPYLCIIGRKEAEAGKVTLRRLGEEAQQVMTVNEALEQIKADGKMPE